MNKGFVLTFLRSSCLQLNNIDVNDTVEGDDRAFEIWHEREDSVRKYLLQARTVNIKNSWVKEICGIQQRISQPVWSEYGLLGTGSLIEDFFSRTDGNHLGSSATSSTEQGLEGSHRLKPQYCSK